jgi:hypothetical protein
MTSLCDNFGRRRRGKKKHKVEYNKILFSFACHHHRVCGCGSLCRVVIDVVAVRSIRCPSTSVWPIPSIQPIPSIRPLPSTNVRPSMFIRCRPSLLTHHILQIVCTIYILIWYCILQTVSIALYCYKILRHRTTPCLRMMRALPLSQNQGISYEVTHNHSSWFFWAHDLHDGVIKRLHCHHHPVQLLLGIQIQVTIHQKYIRVHLEGLINGVCLLLQKLSHHHHIFHCKSLLLHPYTP